MSHLDILLPFGLPPADLAKDLLRELKTPALATLIARAQPSSHKAFDEFLRALPHETWLADRFGFEPRFPLSSSPSVASATMASLGLPQEEGVWFMLHPVSLHITSSQLILTDLRQLKLSEQESRALFDAALPLFDAAGKSLIYGDAQTWFVRADDWHDLRTSTPDAALGQNINGSMPQGSGERDWRKLQNEVQMHWHTHPVNAKREAHKLKPVNSIWLWGGSPITMKVAPSRYRHVFNLSGWMRGFGQFAARQTQAGSVSDLVAAAPEHGLLILDSLIEPALGGEWRNWLDRIDALETDWFAPLLSAMQASKIDRVSLILTHTSGLSEYTASKHSLRKFWVKPALTRLLA
jgi:hypothetical protein